MGKGGGGGDVPKAEPVKKKVGGTVADAETKSLLRRKGLQATKMSRNSLGGGSNLGG
jgi:hypothetical protein